MNKLHLSTTLFFVIAISIGITMGCSDDSSGPQEMKTIFSVEVQNVNVPSPVLKSGVTVSPGGPDEGPAIFPGETASFSFTAPSSTLPPIGGSGMRLNFASMFVQSNDLYYAFPPEGLDLYDDQGNPVTGNVTDQLYLYDAGTEINEEPGVGPNQKPRQNGPNTGDDENGNIVRIENGQQGPGGYTYPDKSEVIEVTIEHNGESQFTVHVTNVSDTMTLETSEGSKPVPLSPFAWAVHEDAMPFALFMEGESASRGLEWIAEDGFPADMIGDQDLPPSEEEGLADNIADHKGLTVPLSPPVYAVHDQGFEPFMEGEDAPSGVSIVAEDGFPAGMLGDTDLPPEMSLVEMLEAEDAVSIVGTEVNANGHVPALEPAADGQGESVEFEITASPGDRLSLFSMFVQSNDLFFSFDSEGIALFDENGNPVSGDITDRIMLWDAGTEVDEEPGVGQNQKPRQGATALDVGPDEEETVTRIENTLTNDFDYPDNSEVIQITITPTRSQ